MNNELQTIDLNTASFDELVRYYEQFENDNPPSKIIADAKFWKNKAGKLHRENDFPAVIDLSYLAWYKEGKLHRDGAPASISNDRIQWFKNGLRHRVDGPALEGFCSEYWLDGFEYSQEEWEEKRKEYAEYYLQFEKNDPPTEIDKVSQAKIWKNSEGRIHRENDLPAVIFHNGPMEWKIKGKLHREGNKPAFINDKIKAYFRNNQLHNMRGPAVVWSDERPDEFWIRDKKFPNKESWEKYIKEKKEKIAKNWNAVKNSETKQSKSEPTNSFLLGTLAVCAGINAIIQPKVLKKKSKKIAPEIVEIIVQKEETQ